MTAPILWVVEMIERGRWVPTVGASLSRSDGRRELRDWRANNPSNKFRLVQYIRRRQP